jgi:branched-chain amino acid transport system substrate-binding protein
MKGKYTSLLLGLALGMLLVIGPAGTAAADTIKIGIAAPFTGGAAAYGDNIFDGVSLKLKEINDAGGINGKMVELVKGDDLCEPKDAGIVGSKFATDKSIVAVIGHVCSSATLAGLPSYVRAKLPSISATSTKAGIGAEVGKGWFFRNCYTDDYQGAFLASYVSKVLGLKKIGVFYENNDYGIGLKNTFIKEAQKVGIEIIGEEGYVKGANDFAPQLTKLKTGKPDGIFICGYYQEGGLIAGQARKMGLDITLFGADGLDNEDYIKIGGKSADGTYCTVPFLAAVAGDEAKGVVDAFKAKTGRDIDWMAANAYDCLGILAEVIAKVGPDRQKIRDGLAAYNSPENAYKGLTGSTYFDENGDCAKPAAVKMVKDGQFVPAKQMN